MRGVRDRTRECTQNRSTLYRDLDEILLTLGRSLRGWANYFRHGSSSRHFQQVDHHAWKRVGAWIRRKHHPIPGGRSAAASPKADDTPTTGSPSTTQPASRSNATAAARSPTPGPSRPPQPRDQRARHTESRMRGQPARPVRAGGQRKRTESNPGTAPLADPTAARTGRSRRPTGRAAGAPLVLHTGRAWCPSMGTTGVVVYGHDSSV
ncbi:group II intron maturase-specific domain-containing protein [Micromonospora pallida]|uniref:group II intron maturase-specific domain-containing protein n=1 Tax=Micromonospora pallida TaxID=145854 RepID=UPI003CCBF99B